VALNDDQVFAAWSQGKRERQEDFNALARLLPGTAETAPDILVVADGMGGQAAGDVASQAAVQNFLESGRTGLERSAAQRLRDGLNQANAAVGQQAAADPARAGMGTTLVAVELRGDTAHWISVGDSPFYLLRSDELTRQNADHSLQGMHMEAAARGEISVEEAKARGGSNQLRSALMGAELSLIDTNGLEPGLALKPGDVLILASDGLLSLTDDQICDIALKNRRSAKALAKALVAAVDRANKPRQDNATVVAYVHPGEPPPLPKKRKKKAAAATATSSRPPGKGGDVAVATGIAVAATLALVVWAAVSLINRDDAGKAESAPAMSGESEAGQSEPDHDETGDENLEGAAPDESAPASGGRTRRKGGEEEAGNTQPTKPDKRRVLF
jgi:PPM family protein phosphatase